MIEFTKWRDEESEKRLQELRTKNEKHSEYFPVILWILLIGFMIGFTYYSKHKRIMGVEAKNKAKIAAIYDIAKAETHSYSVVDVNNDSICNIILQNIIKKTKAQNITVYSATINSAGLFVTYSSDGIVANTIVKDMLYEYQYDLNTLNIIP